MLAEEEAVGSAYTPGLTVSGDIVVRRIRRLPIKGEVLVKVGDEVEPHTPVARAQLPGRLETIKLAEKLGVEANQIKQFFQLSEGDPIEKGQTIAETKGFMGFFKATVNSDYEGTVEAISEITGNVLVREQSIPIDLSAYVRGQIVDILPEEGAVVETRGAMVQGIFGVGGERTGVVKTVVSDPSERLEATHITEADKGKIIVGGRGITLEAMHKASEIGVTGVIVGAIRDVDLTEFLGYDIGVAITGQENINLTLMATEGFGELQMADRTFELLRSIEGREASMNGATQIRAGVIRPEVIAPSGELGAASEAAAGGATLSVGTPIRVIREPYFGTIGSVTGLPSQPQVVESGAKVRILEAKLQDGREVTVPRANVEIIES